MREMYIYQYPDWPKFSWDAQQISDLLARVRFVQGQLLGKMQAQGFAVRKEADWLMVTEDVIQSSAIEGEQLPLGEVRSSVARRLGIKDAGLPRASRDVEGIVEMMLDASRNFEADLTQERLFGWHAAMFPTGFSGMARIDVGQWRNHNDNDPMQVLSGAMGKERVHFQAPSAGDVPAMMRNFLDWVNQPTELDPILKAGLAHLWFLTVHPFDDGNGRIARAITDRLLARSDGTSQRFYSMSSAILRHRKQYYLQLESAQKSKLDITRWLHWFLETLATAIDASNETLTKVLAATRFWQLHQDTILNERQRKIIGRLQGDFKGKLTSSKYAKITKVSQDTATRDLNDLVSKGVLTKGAASGRSTHYQFVEVDTL